MLFHVSEECARLGLRAGAIVFREVRVAAASTELRAEIAREVQALRARFPSPQDIRSPPEVIGFRDILAKVGVKPRKVQPSIERLIAHVLKRGDLPAINSLVDAYNLVSIRSLCSLGAHDLDRINPPVTLRLLTGQETFTPLGQTTAVPVVAGEFGYVDAANRLLCRLDVLQAEFSKVTGQTVNALLIVEGTSAHSPQVLRQSFTAAIELVTRYCGGTGEVVRG